MTAERMIKQGSSWSSDYEHQHRLDIAGAPNRASALSISHLPFVLFPDRSKARQSIKPLLPSDIDVVFPFSTLTPPPPLPMLRQAGQQHTLAQPLYSLPLPTRTVPNSEPRVLTSRPSASVVLAIPSIPNLPQPLPMAGPSISIQAAPLARQLPQVGPAPSSSSGPRVRPLPQRPPTAKPIEDESLWAEPGDMVAPSNITQANEVQSDLDSNALRRNRHIRRATKVPLNGPRPLPPLPGTTRCTSLNLTEPFDPSKRASSPAQRAPHRSLAALQRSKSDPISPPLPRKPYLSLVIPMSQPTSTDPTTPNYCGDESPGSTRSQRHSLDYFPTIDYASVATPNSSRRPPPSAYPDGGKENGTTLDWHLLEQALGIDGDDIAVAPGAPPVVESFLPCPDAPPVPVIPDRFLSDPSAQLPEDHKSRRTVDSILAMVIDYERELLNQFPIPPATR